MLDARKLIEQQTGIPAIVFGLVQAFVLGGIYYAIVRKERAMASAREQAVATHEGHARQTVSGAPAPVTPSVIEDGLAPARES